MVVIVPRERLRLGGIVSVWFEASELWTSALKVALVVGTPLHVISWSEVIVTVLIAFATLISKAPITLGAVMIVPGIVTAPVVLSVVKFPAAGVVPPIAPGAARRAVRAEGTTARALSVPVTVSAFVAISSTPVALSLAACLIFANAVAALATSERLFAARRSP